MYVEVGKVKDAHGIKGELFLVLFAGEASWLPKLKTIRLVSADRKSEKSLTLKSARLHKNGLIAKTNEIDNRNDAEALRGFLFEIPEEFLISGEGEGLFLREVEGFKVFTKDRGEIGVIIGFSSNSVQDLLIVKTSWGNFEIPFVDEFVTDLDKKKKELHLDIPIGLLGELDAEKNEGSAE